MKFNKLAIDFEIKLKALANDSDANIIAKMLGNNELMTEVLDSILEGLKQNLDYLEADSQGDEKYMANVALIKQQNELFEAAIMSVYPQISALDAKLQESF